MSIGYYIAMRILQLCEEQNLSINELSLRSFLTQSTVQHIVSGKSKNPKLYTIYSICKGLNVSIYDFFDNDIFKDLDLNIL